MKNIIRIIALLMVAVFALTLLVGCGKSMDSIKEKIKDLDEDEYGYEKFSKEMKEMLAEEFEDELDIDLDGDIEGGYAVYDEDGENVMIIEFEKSGDAKEFAKAMEEYIEDEGEEEDMEDYIVEVSGKIVAVASNKKLLKKVW